MNTQDLELVKNPIGEMNLMSVYEGFPGGLDGKESTCNMGDLGSIPGSGRSPGGGHGNLV